MTLKLNAASGGSVALDAPTQTTSSNDIIFKLPVADGTAGQVLRTDGSGNLSWVDDQKGKILQVVNVIKTSSAETTNTNVSSHPYGVAVSGFSASITPSSSSNKVLVRVTFGLTNSTDGFYAYAFLYKGNTLLGAATTTGNPGGLFQQCNTIERLDSPNTTSSTTYSIRIAAEGNTTKIGRRGAQGSNDDERLSDCTMTLMEVSA